MSNPRSPSRLSAPVQAPPVNRDNWSTSTDQHKDSGVEASASGCAHLPGAARQLCYAMRGTRM
ncbi:hypothetical protein ABZY19_33705 [Streptomyces sp. NPDC006475]|uniref:hypothetical protein n=1 Tax=Streptomyces sp. NPDC006475 TaxID=3155719 RepID=UPI00339FBB6D